MVDNKVTFAVGKALPHESAHLHVRGEAEYVDDQHEPRGMLYAAIGYSARAHARIRQIDFSAVRSAPGVVDIITAEDIPGANNHGPWRTIRFLPTVLLNMSVNRCLPCWLIR